jgi:tryptophanyl-tRNA synthetase
MSKSAESPGTVTLLEDPLTITKRFKSAVTDSANEIRYDPDAKPGVSNLIQILAATTGREPAAVVAEYSGQGYGALKSAVADAVVALLAPIQERYTELDADPAFVDRALALGAEKAEETAATVIERVRAAAGLLPRA